MYYYVDKYTVKQGDTLSAIAQSYDLVSYRQILRVNPEISNPQSIYPGQIINIPKFTPMSTYRVRAGDTLGDIIYLYNRDHIEIYGVPITLDEVLAYNPGIEDPDLIYPNMILYLPEIL